MNKKEENAKGVAIILVFAIGFYLLYNGLKQLNPKYSAILMVVTGIYFLIRAILPKKS